MGDGVNRHPGGQSYQSLIHGAFSYEPQLWGKLLFISGIREARTVESYTFIRCAIYFPVYRLCESRHCPNGGSSFMSF